MSICVVEMGYTAEPIYRDKITDRPMEIDRRWVLNLMEQSGHFDTIELHPTGENGIWRDIFVGSLSSNHLRTRDSRMVFLMISLHITAAENSNFQRRHGYRTSDIAGFTQSLMLGCRQTRTYRSSRKDIWKYG